MSKVEVNNFAFSTDYNNSRPPVKARLYASASFVTDGGELVHFSPIGSANFYKEAAVTVASGIITIGGFTTALGNAIDSTTRNSEQNGVTYTLVLVDAKGRPTGENNGIVFDNCPRLKVPDTLTPTTWQNIVEFSLAPLFPQRFTEYYTAAQTDVKFAGLSLAPDASNIVKGRSRLSRAPVLVNDPIAVGDNDERLEDDLQRYASLAAAITAIGATPTILNISTTYSHSAGLATIPSTLYLRFKNEARIKGEGGTIAFQGLGVLDTDTRIPYFEGFTAGQVTWTGSVYPKVISTEIFYTGDESLTDRINFVDQATQNKKVMIKCYPRILTGSAVISSYHGIYFTDGEYPNTCPGPASSTIHPPIRMKDHTWMDGSPGNIVYESNVESNCRIVYNYKATEVNGIYETSEDIQIRNINFRVTNDALVSNFNHSTVYFGNTDGGIIENCTFYRTRGYSVIFGGLGDQGNHCNNCVAQNNQFIQIGTQTLSVTNGINIRFINNYFDVRDSQGSSTFTVIDIEPNIDADIVENIVVAGNFINAADPNGFTKTIYGIAGQATSGIGNNITIRNNTIFGAPVLPVPADGSPLGNGISVTGFLEAYVHGNTVRSGYQHAINIVNCQGARVFGNAGYQLQDVDGLGPQILIQGAAGSSIHDNTLDSSPFGMIQRNGIYETEGQATATATASTITLTDNTLIVYPFWVGLDVFYNGTEYEVATRTSNLVFTTTVAVGTVAAKTFTNANVTTGVGTSNIAITSHGFLTGARVRPTGSDLPAPLTGADVYVIKIDANNIQLATTLDLANAGTEIDFTDTGSGTSTLTPVLTTRFSSNKYWANDADFGIRLEPTGSSVIYSTNRGDLPNGARIAPRVTTIASSATPTPNGDTSDVFTVTALAANATFGAPTGTPVNCQPLTLRITDNGTARTLAWNAIYRSFYGAVLPYTTVINKTLYIELMWNSASSTWDCQSVREQL